MASLCVYSVAQGRSQAGSQPASSPSGIRLLFHVAAVVLASFAAIRVESFPSR